MSSAVGTTCDCVRNTERTVGMATITMMMTGTMVRTTSIAGWPWDCTGILSPARRLYLTMT